MSVIFTKFTVLFMFSLLLAIGLTGQTIAPQLIAAAGSHGATSKVLVDFSIGETLTTSLSNENYMITQGFQQPSDFTFLTSSYTDENNSVLVYPNPVFEFLSLSLRFQKQRKIRIRLFDEVGRFIFHKQLFGLHIFDNIQMQALPQGIYYLQLNEGNNELNHHFTISKI